METVKHTGLSITKKFFILLCFLFVLAASSSWLYLDKSKDIGAYDDLNFRLTDIKFTMVKLEYTLDMFLVARHFEQEKIDVIPEDIRAVDVGLRELENSIYSTFPNNGPIVEGIKFLSEDWRLIKSDLLRLNTALSYDVVLLLHNSIDMNMFLFSEKIDKLLSDIARGREAIFTDIRVLVTRVLIASVVLVIIASALFLMSAFAPIRELSTGAVSILKGDYNVSFNDDASGEAGVISKAMNHLEAKLNKATEDIERSANSWATDIETGRKYMAAFTELSDTAGSSLSQHEIFISALNIMVFNVGASAAAFYLMDEKGNLIFKAASGLDTGFSEDVKVISPTERLISWIDNPSHMYLKDIEEYPDGKLKNFLKMKNYGFVSSAPISYNKEVIGVMLLIFDNAGDFVLDSEPFIRAVASFAGAVTGHLNLFYEEHGKKNFVDSIVQQCPMGIAVFGFDGSAIMLNTTLKRMLGVQKESDFIGKYKVFEDNIFDSKGIMPMIRESYDGHVNEAVLDYDPSILTWYDFNGLPLRVKVKSFPLYDAGGEISSIALLYEDIPAFSETLSSIGGNT